VSVKTGAARYLADGATPRWSPDGRRIAFSVAVRSNAFYCVEKHLFSITPDGSDRRRLAADPQPFMAQTPTSWSPDGARIAFTEAPGGIECNGPSRAMLAARDGNKPTHVIGEGVARWLTGGRRLVLQYSSYYGVPTVGIVRPSGRVVARFVNAYDFTPSPEGRRIVLSFAGRLTLARIGGKGGRHWLAGGDLPSWSSQNWIAFSAARGCARTVDRAFVVRPSGKHLHALTRCPPSS
jgi:Tol biopolymer transport system component